MSQDQVNETWLSLREAAAFLDVHPATLRRWADNGQIPHLLTPGGHRRFARTDLEQFAASHRVAHRDAARRALSLPEVWVTQAMLRTRQDVPGQVHEGWLAALDEPTRERHRALGRRLIGLTLQYISTNDGAHLLEEASAVGRDYAALSKASSMPLTDALHAALFFRDKLLEAALDLAHTAQVRPADNSNLVKRINTLLNTVQLAIAEVYEGGPVVEQPPPIRRKRRARRAP